MKKTKTYDTNKAMKEAEKNGFIKKDKKPLKGDK